MVKNSLFLFFVFTLVSCALIPNTYRAASISGTVVDEKTGQPLSGVNVVVYWKLYTGGFGGRVTKGILKVDETVTDKHGKYHFDSWGPVNVYSSRLGYEVPELLFFKPGYYYQRKQNSRSQMYFGKRGAGEIHVPVAEETDKGMLYRSQWDKKEIELKNGSYSEKRYIDNLEFLSLEMSGIIRYKFSCKEKTIYGLINYVREQIKELNKRKIRHIVGDPDTIPVVRDCK